MRVKYLSRMEGAWLPLAVTGSTCNIGVYVALVAWKVEQEFKKIINLPCRSCRLPRSPDNYHVDPVTTTGLSRPSQLPHVAFMGLLPLVWPRLMPLSKIILTYKKPVRVYVGATGITGSHVRQSSRKWLQGVAISWQLRGLRGCYGIYVYWVGHGYLVAIAVYMAVTGSTWLLHVRAPRALSDMAISWQLYGLRGCYVLFVHWVRHDYLVEVTGSTWLLRGLRPTLFDVNRLTWHFYVKVWPLYNE